MCVDVLLHVPTGAIDVCYFLKHTNARTTVTLCDCHAFFPFKLRKMPPHAGKSWIEVVVASNTYCFSLVMYLKQWKFGDLPFVPVFQCVSSCLLEHLLWSEAIKFEFCVCIRRMCIMTVMVVTLPMTLVMLYLVYLDPNFKNTRNRYQNHLKYFPMSSFIVCIDTQSKLRLITMSANARTPN